MWRFADKPLVLDCWKWGMPSITSSTFTGDDMSGAISKFSTKESSKSDNPWGPMLLYCYVFTDLYLLELKGIAGSHNLHRDWRSGEEVSHNRRADVDVLGERLQSWTHRHRLEVASSSIINLHLPQWSTQISLDWTLSNKHLFHTPSCKPIATTSCSLQQSQYGNPS